MNPKTPNPARCGSGGGAQQSHSGQLHTRLLNPRRAIYQTQPDLRASRGAGAAEMIFRLYVDEASAEKNGSAAWLADPDRHKVVPCSCGWRPELGPYHHFDRASR
jgi:hypothetical protein